MVREAQLKKKATGSSSNFSKEKLSTLFFNSYKNSLDPKFLVKGLDDTLRIAFDGNEVPVLTAKKTVMAKLNTRFGNLGDKEFDNALKGEVQEFNVQKTKYIQGVVKDVNINAAQAKNKIHTAPTITGNLTEAQKRQRANEQIRAKIMDGTYKAGDLINYGNNEYRIVTDTGLL